MEKNSNSKKMTKSELKANTTTTPSSNSVTSNSTNKTTPKDSQIVSAILKDMAIVEYEPRIVHQMIEFTYRYVSNVLEEAQYFSSYAKKKTIDSDDISLAIQLKVDKGFTGPPPRDLLLEIARSKNNQALPPIKSHNGPRLPADRYSLIACNYKQKTNNKAKQISLPFRSSITGTSLLNTSNNNNTSGLKPIASSLTTPRPGPQTMSIQIPSRLANNSSTLTIKTSDSQSLMASGVKRKLDESSM